MKYKIHVSAQKSRIFNERERTSCEEMNEWNDSADSRGPSRTEKKKKQKQFERAQH